MTARSRKAASFDGDHGDVKLLEALWIHRANVARRAQTLAPPLPPPMAQDIGDVAVLQDEGELIATPNAFDLKSTGLRFTRNADGTYQLSKIDATFRSTLGSRLSLGDDDSTRMDLPFGFPFYSGSFSAAFVNTDGNVTFDQQDKESTERSVGRFLSGPPRVAVFFADLDPTSGGRVFANAANDGFTVTWCAVRGFESTEAATVQVTMLSNGSIEMKFGANVGVPSAVVGISPGRTSSFNPVDLSAGSASAAATQAIGERFGQQREIDLAAVGLKFYATHPDAFDQIVIFTDQRASAASFAYELTVANQIRGIGVGIFNASREFGSAGRLGSFVDLDLLTRYPEDPLERRFGVGENSLVSLMGQECGHRWLAHMRFRDPNGVTSNVLLGRDTAHWSFFFDSDASVMEGNDIEDLGAGSFRTVDTVRRYSLLDQYAMGLVSEAEMAPFFYVENPTNINPPINDGASTAPRTGVTFNGTRRDVRIQDVVAALGPRDPSARDSDKVFRQAFVYVIGPGKAVDVGQVDKVDRIRRAWTTFFGEATDGRMRAETRLRPPS